MEIKKREEEVKERERERNGGEDESRRREESVNTIPLPRIDWYRRVTSVSHRAHPHDSSSGSRYIIGYGWQ